MKFAQSYTLSSPRPRPGEAPAPVVLRVEIHADSPDGDAAASAHRDLAEHIERLCDRGGRFALLRKSPVFEGEPQGEA